MSGAASTPATDAEGFEVVRNGERVRVVSWAVFHAAIRSRDIRIGAHRRFAEGVRKNLGMAFASTDGAVLARVADLAAQEETAGNERGGE